ncbi:MAG: ferritin family protein [candidate division WOR-3 bacterium]|nr:MAG: ferritin family protein [candidate division WOR-3 bacterium]
MERSKAIKGLMNALQTELNGIEFYRIAAEKTEDAKGKKVFQTLADDELKHFNTLQQQYKALANEGRWQKISLGNISIFEGESPIFTDELKHRVKGMHFEVTALSIGAQLETNSIDFYRKMKEESDDPTAKEMYEKLQKWEEVHLNAISKQLDLIKEDYWAEQRFSPLY